MDKTNGISIDADNTPANVNVSKLFMRSIGRAAENIDGTNRILEIVPLEEVGYLDGEINNGRNEVMSEGVDFEGNTFSLKIETSNVIAAEWFPFGTNRVHPPNIRRGERVLLWQYADTDKYYWTATGFDDNVRRLETVVFRTSNSIDETDKTITPENSYWAEMSTQHKHITLSTSKSNGEAFKYTIQIDTSGSRLTICDDANNFIELNSPEKRITLNNTDGTHIILDKTNMKIHANDTIDITCKTLNINTTESNMTSSATTNVKSKTTNLTASTSTTIAGGATAINTSDTSFKGGSTTFDGPYTFLGSVAFKGAVTSNGKDISSGHTHKNSGGSGTGGPVS